LHLVGILFPHIKLYHISNFEEIGKHTWPLLRNTVFISPFSRMYLSHARRMLHVPLITLTIASFCVLCCGTKAQWN